MQRLCSIREPARCRRQRGIGQGRNLNARDLLRALTADFAVRYTKSLTIGARKKKTNAKRDMAHELMSRTYGEKEWLVVFVNDK